MKRITILILVIIMGLSLVACGGNSNDDTPKVGDFTPVPCEVAVHDFFITSFYNEPYIVLYLDITNKTDASLPADDLAYPTLYQNGAQVADLHDDDSWMKRSDIIYPDGFEPALRFADRIQSGATATVYYVLPIKNTTDDITVEVYGCETHITDNGGSYIAVSEDVIFTDTLKIS